MNFHSYVTHRRRALNGFTQTPDQREAHSEHIRQITQMSSYEFAMWQGELLKQRSAASTNPDAKSSAAIQAILLLNEEFWHRDQRPFYNVWPIMHDIVGKIDLHIPWQQLRLPFDSLLCQFPIGHERFRAKTMMISLQRPTPPGTGLIVAFESQLVNEEDSRVWARPVPDPTLTVHDTLLAANVDSSTEETQHLAYSLRLTCLLSLIADGEDLVTPVLLAKDAKEEPVLDEDRLKEWIIRKAEKAKQSGAFGFDVGKQLFLKKEHNPTFVLPYWAIRWTGKGASIPRYVCVSAHAKGLNPLLQVPTGWLGYETQEELDQAVSETEQLEYVYFLRDGDRPYVKIGFTKREVAKRLKDLATANRRLILLGLIPTADARRKEAVIHRELRNTIRDGEFFYISNALCRQIIQAHGGRWLLD